MAIFFSHAQASSKACEGDACYKICRRKEPECPDDWCAKNIGSDEKPCWTCCK
ncbi:hypothetical protein AJ78_04117 [Emergomyces pasteurianus Ep9510]|uniref:Uncharacterized protein n=1 Tax=Emergomyces pasteurianus Ep9510 TaxID=1447872 RepID=A0A1J9PGW4_9EURO|nr:hypothetical protein AJ78_04117 [Emergomyces pasteurianus Ep9510]